jgi:hypothetical protein
MTNKEMIAAFYRELYEGREVTKEYKEHALARLGMLLQQFRLKYTSFPGPVQDPWEFFSYKASLNWFPKHKKMLEQLSDEFLIGKVDKEFRTFLRDEQKLTRPLEGLKTTPEPERELVVAVPPPHKVQGHKVVGGNWSLDGQRADHQNDKIILALRKPTDVEKARAKREFKKLLRSYRPLVRRLKRQKDDLTLQLVRSSLQREVNRLDDAELRQEELWKLVDAINTAIKKATPKN